MSTRPHPDWQRGAINGAVFALIAFGLVIAFCYLANLMPRLASLSEALDLSPWNQPRNLVRALIIAGVGGSAFAVLVALRPSKDPNQPILSRAFQRSLIYLGIAFGFLVWDIGRRSWKPERVLETEHFEIQSTASQEATETVAEAVEALHSAYTEFFSSTNDAPDHRYRMKLFRDREEFRFANRIQDWAEAFYLKPFCYAYYDGKKDNPHHWMLHEATHQLNWERSRFELKEWLEEGIACYFGASTLEDGELRSGVIDKDAYPVWWLNDLKLSGKLQEDIAAGEIIPLNYIVSGQGGPPKDQEFNRYYLHWWTLVHFLFEYDNQQYREPTFGLIQDGGGLDRFEHHLGDIEDIQREWYGYVIFLQSRDLQKIQPKKPPTRE